MARRTKPMASAEEQPSDLSPLLEAMRGAGNGDFSLRVEAVGPGLSSDLALAFNRLMEACAARAEGPPALVPSLDDRALESLRDALQHAAEGDFSVRLRPPETTLIGDVFRGFNDLLGLNERFACEIDRLSGVIGQDGCLAERASLGAVGGAWESSINALNELISDLVQPSSEVARVITAVAEGDLTQSMSLEINGRPLKGEYLRVGTTVNTMVDQLSRFADEVTRVAREVGSEGKLGGQAHVKGVAGIWQDLTDNVNFLAGNLTSQVRNIAHVTTAVANGDLSQKITVDVRGEILELKNTINTMVDQLRAFAAEVTRVAREVGTEGKLGGQANVPGVAGTWKDLTDNVNTLADNLTTQVRDVSKVATAIARGDLTQKITVEVRGEILQIKNTINTMVDQLRAFASEVTRVSREVGIEGKLGGQAHVKGVAGIWQDLTDNVNFLAGNLTSQVRNIAHVTTAVANGDLSQKITVDVRGEILELKNTINTMVDHLRAFASEVTRMAREVGSEGKLGGQAYVKGVSGTWKDLTDTVNLLADNLTVQLRDVSKVATAIAKGNLSQKITVDVRGEMLQIKETINTMVDQLSRFADEVTRVSREVGTEGRLGGHALVPGVAGTWKDLTDSVNMLADNLTVQLRDVSKVATAIAKGDLSRKITVDVRGEMLQIKDVINTMVDQLSRFADEVTRVAREVGTEGRLGGQAQVKGVSGTWKDLTDSVNLLAGNLTSQVRAIAEVSTAVAQGDLSRTITIGAQGEVSELKDNLNRMIANLRETTEKNTQQSWLKTNLARFSRLFQGQKSLEQLSRLLMTELPPVVEASYGAFYLQEAEQDTPILRRIDAYASHEGTNLPDRFKLGEGLVGQAARDRRPILLKQVPGDFMRIALGPGAAPPVNFVVLPVVFEGEVKAVVELASFQPFSPIHLSFLDQLIESLGVVLNMLAADTRTAALLEELRRSNAELGAKAGELEEKASQLQATNKEVELASVSLEERAEQLALVSRYKSEFLANMSHELRTPLNSLLILARLLAENKEGNLDSKQVEYATTIVAAGSDLLSLINEVLDLSKVESGKMPVDAHLSSLSALRDYVRQTFCPIAQQKGVDFTVDLDPDLPEAICTDGERLKQVLRNLLANAFKFTEEGRVTLHVGWAPEGGAFESETLRRSPRVLAFAVTDTGIGVPAEKHQLIFEAFQQADSTTSRKYGGTGLGLTISREVSGLLGGEIHVESEPGRGSTFTLYLPQTFDVPDGEPDLFAYGSRIQAPGHVSFAPGPPPAEPPAVAPAVPEAPSCSPDDLLSGKTLLVVEDDMRSLFAMTSLLERKGAKVIFANSGQDALDLLAKHPEVDLVLMDLMMPGMDGAETVRAIRHMPGFQELPIIALTAKAMKGDREKSLAAGASDYITKPVDAELLLSMLCAWLEPSLRTR